MQDTNLATAKQYLEMAERNPDQLTISIVRRNLATANAKPEDIGTTEKQLQELEKLGNIATAKQYLEMAERNPDQLAISVVRRNLATANAKPEDIGTTEKRLQELEKLGNLAIAKQYLEMARNHDRSAISVVRRNLATAYAKPEDIGTTEKQLQELEKLGT